MGSIYIFIYIYLNLKTRIGYRLDFFLYNLKKDIYTYIFLCHNYHNYLKSNKETEKTWISYILLL